jgi:hypothetical protein
MEIFDHTVKRAARGCFAVLMGISLFLTPLSAKFYIRASRPVTKSFHVTEHRTFLSLDKRYELQKFFAIEPLVSEPYFEQPRGVLSCEYICDVAVSATLTFFLLRGPPVGTI